MKRIIVTLALVFGLALPALAQDSMPSGRQLAKAGNLGLGLGGSAYTSTGLSAKYYLASNTALQGNVGFWGGWGWGWGWGIAANVDGVYEQQFFDHEVLSLFYNAGAGANVGVGSGLGLGVSGVLGVGLHLKQFPLEITTHWRPTVFFTGEGLWLGNGGGAVRWYF